MKKILSEFKLFAVRGNMVDMAIGIIIGAAFTGVVNSLVNDVIMPPLTLLLGGVDFTNFSITLREAKGESPALVLNYGAFIGRVIDFTIVAFAVFMMIKGMNRLVPKKKEVAKRLCPECCMDIPTAAKRCGHCSSPLAAVGNKK